MPTEDAYNAIVRQLEGMTHALEGCKRELSDDRMDMRGVTTRLDGLEREVSKLREVVIEGNGAESLKARVGMNTRAVNEATRTMAELTKRIESGQVEQKKIDGARNVALISAATTVVVALITLLGSK